MKEVKAQIEDIRKQIQDRKDSRKSLSDTQKKLQDQINISRTKRATLSEEIKNLVNSIASVRTQAKASKASTPKKVSKKVAVAA